MSKRQVFRDFVKERLAAAALDILWQYEKTLAECQAEICRLRERSAEQQGTFDVIRPEIKLPDAQKLSLPDPPQRRGEDYLWTNQEEKQLQGLQSDTTDSRFTSPGVKTCCDPEDSSQLPPPDQTPSVENSDLSTNMTEEQIKKESDGEYYDTAEPARDSQIPDCRTTETMASGLSLLPIGVLKSPIHSAHCSSCSSPDSCLKTSPSIWTKPITSPHLGAESDVSPGESENKAVEKPHQCGECDKVFNSKQSLVSHRRIHTREKHFQCDECDKSYFQKVHLVYHKRIHTGDKPYKCEDCGKGFIEKRNLLSHRRIHTGEKPYKCDECDKVYRHQASLGHHKAIHTGEKPYHCEECDEAFRYKIQLNRHRTRHSGDCSGSVKD